jgi:hypothetical protein
MLTQDMCEHIAVSIYRQMLIQKMGIMAYTFSSNSMHINLVQKDRLKHIIEYKDYRIDLV